VRGVKESGSGGETGVIPVGFLMRNGFRERLVTGLKDRGHYGKKAGRQAYEGSRQGGEISWLQDVHKRAAWKWMHWEQRDEKAGCWG